MNFHKAIACATMLLLTTNMFAVNTYYLNDFGIQPNQNQDMSERMTKALAKIKQLSADEDSITIEFRPGRYYFHASKAETQPYYISNHDQDGIKAVAINLDGWSNTTLNGQGADIVCDGVILPIALVNSTNCSIKNLSVDFKNPHIAQVEILKSDSTGITFRPTHEVKYKLDNHTFVSYGRGWERRPNYGMCFEKESHHILYRTSDTWCGIDSVIKQNDGALYAPKWINQQLVPGTQVTLRTWDRPAPALFLSGCTNTALTNVTVHYAEGMGLLAQLCENIHLDGFKVALRKDSGRYFTTQADATHFSGCKGHITSINGLYESMMDDAINVHGTYLKIKNIIDNKTVVAQYMHSQTYGMQWGFIGDSIKVVNSATMDYEPTTYIIHKIDQISDKEFKIMFTTPLPANINVEQGLGLENITWTPSVLFANNIVRNNRARGSLFSTPKKVIVENNIYDHTSGSAILLSGDCNGWFETGACRDVTIRNNRFINALTSMYQFTEAVISIYPVIPQLSLQKSYFHGSKNGIVIENNEFVTFDTPLVYAISVDGLKIMNNKIFHNHDFPAYHSNKYAFKLNRVKNTIIAGNQNDTGELSILIE
ncbi:MAG: alpha-1,3-galactosidase B [Paramuribaculum sp.]|nr:alpha-1,3-galactosidase B [Paramuribaculum sp.]